MKRLSETKALIELQNLKKNYQDFIKTNFEDKAKNCLTCETKGACCQDAHFVNVHITKLEAVAIGKTLDNLGEKRQREVYERAEETIKKYNLSAIGDTFKQTFACPLFEKEIGCLIHVQGKPAPCISHACYEKKEDLPPEKFQEEIENHIEKLNKRAYGKTFSWLPLPVWLDFMNPFKEEIILRKIDR